MKLLTLLKKNIVVILFILSILALVLYMNYKPEGFQATSTATTTPPTTTTTTPQYKPFPF